MGISTVREIVPDVIKAIWDNLVNKYLPVPTVSYWQEIALGFKERWNFPNCVVAIDGKHVVIQAPHISGFKCSRMIFKGSPCGVYIVSGG